VADTSIKIDPGSTTDVDTRTEATNGNHRQVIVIGDPSVNAGVAPVDGTKGLAVDLTNSGQNTAKFLVTPDLPTGASTSAKQDTGNSSLSSIDGKITACNTGAVTISSSALPTSAATSIKQSDGSQKTQVVDGSGNVIGATSNALDVNIKSGNPTTFNPSIAGGQTLLNYTGDNAASGDLIGVDGSKAIYITAYSLITSDTTGTKITFQDNASTSIWTVPLQAITGTVCGANLAVPAPAYLFSVAAGHKLSCLNSNSKTVTISLTYFKV